METKITITSELSLNAYLEQLTRLCTASEAGKELVKVLDEKYASWDFVLEIFFYLANNILSSQDELFGEQLDGSGKRDVERLFQIGEELVKTFEDRALMSAIRDPRKKVYLASRFSSRFALQPMRDYLLAYGYEVTSRWISEPHEVTQEDRETLAAEECQELEQKFAIEDWEDVRRADILLFFLHSSRSESRGGRHVEFGMAYALGKKCVLIGTEMENIFHYLPGVFYCASVEKFIEGKVFSSYPEFLASLK